LTLGNADVQARAIAHPRCARASVGNAPVGGLKEVPIKREAFLGCLLILALAGCGAQSARPGPPHVVKHFVAAVPKLNPDLERSAGRLSAAVTLLQKADAALQSAYSMQSIQLPESAQSSLSDANTNIVGARVVFKLGAVSPAYATTASLLTKALAAFSLATSYGVRSESRGREKELRGRTLLNEAGSSLARDPQAAGPLAQAALQYALFQAARASIPRAVPRRLSSHRSRPRIHPAFTVVVRGTTLVATRTPTPIPSPTSLATSSRIASSLRPTYTSGRLSARIPRVRVLATSTPIARRAVSAAAGVINARDAAARITRCGNYLRSLAVGDDPLGSAKILRCLSRVAHSLRSIADGLTIMIEATVPRLTGGHAVVARSAARAAIAGLKKAESDVRSANVATASSRLIAIARLVDKTRKQMLLMQAGKTSATPSAGH
jgi:hypothetical protein